MSGWVADWLCIHKIGYYYYSKLGPVSAAMSKVSCCESLVLEDIKVLPSVQHQCRCTESSHLHISRTQRFVGGLSFSCRKPATVWGKVHQNCKGSQIGTPVAMYVDYTHLPAFQFVTFSPILKINLWKRNILTYLQILVTGTWFIWCVCIGK